MNDSDSAFIGDIPAHYERYLGPLIFREYAEDLAKRIRVPAGGIVLETAAGTGMATRQLRDSVPQDVRIVATDLNIDMLNVAKDKFTANENIDFQIENALELSFDDATFDSVVCQFSVMFFPDKLKAIQEAARVMKPGGRFYFNIWDSFEHNQLVNIVNATVAELIPEDPPQFFKVPYGYHDINVLKDLLCESGFADVEISVLPRVSATDQARDVALGYVMGTPVRLQIEQRDPKSTPSMVDAVERAVGEAFGYRNIEAKMQAIVFTAHYPG